MNKLTAKLYACIPGRIRREFQVSVREEYASEAIRLTLGTRDGRVVWSCLMTLKSVDEMSKKTLKVVVIDRCDQMAAALRAWALENPDGTHTKDAR